MGHLVRLMEAGVLRTCSTPPSPVAGYPHPRPPIADDDARDREAHLDRGPQTTMPETTALGAQHSTCSYTMDLVVPRSRSDVEANATQKSEAAKHS